jgi:uncharacterized protein (TIGR03382 family)
VKLLSMVAISVLLVPSIAEAAVTTYAVVMTSQQEVPSAGTRSTSTATGSTTLAFDNVTKTLTGTLTYAGLSGPAVESHIHAAPCGVSGAVDRSLGLDLGSPIALNVVLNSEEETALVTNNLYLDFHTAMYPDGEIRGQILSAGSPMCTGPKQGSGAGTRPAGANVGAETASGAGVDLGSHIDAADAAASPVDASAPCPSSGSAAPHADAGADAASGGEVGCSAAGSAPSMAWFFAGALVVARSVRRRRGAATQARGGVGDSRAWFG